MVLRLVIYCFLIVIFLLIFCSVRQKNGGNFSVAIEIFLPIGIICFVILGGDLEVRMEIAQNYRQYQELQNKKTLQDVPPQLLEGITNIPPDATIIEGDREFRLIAPQGKFFTWGVFKLKSMVLNDAKITIYPDDLIEDFPDVVNINGISCQTNRRIELVRQDNYLVGQDFKLFRVFYCVTSGWTLQVGDEELFESKGLSVNFYLSLDKYLIDYKELIPFKHYLPSEQPFIEAYSTFKLFAPSPQHKLRLDFMGDVIADMHGNIKLIHGELYTCDTEACSLKITPQEPVMYRFGQCEYPQGVTAYLVNFKEGEADWHFKIGARATRYGEKKDLKPISPQCAVQRLPYLIETQHN